MLSVFYVKNPWLQFEETKLKFEAVLQKQDVMTYSIVWPKVFLKSVSEKLEVIQSRAPFAMLGDGEVTHCNSISRGNLAACLIDYILDTERKNKIIDLGGQDEPFTVKK